MKKNTFYSIISLMLTVSLLGELKGQTCGTVQTKESLEFFARLDARFSQQEHPTGRTAAKIEVMIPIKFHTIVTRAGEGGLTESQYQDILDNINEFYSNAKIQFEHDGGFDGVNVIVDDDNYDLESSNSEGVAAANDISQTINVYFSGTLRSENNPLCGYTRFPPSADRIFVTYDCTINRTTLEHELGHYFTLFHTHGTTNTGTTDELVDRSNCTSAGDRLCDTPADPNLFGEVNQSCDYTGSRRDENGEAYKPDVSNIMAYSREACQNKFSADQYDRVRRGFEEGRDYLNYTTESFSAKFITDNPTSCIGSQINFSAESFGAESFEWTFEGGDPSISTSEEVNVTYNQGGSFSVTLRATNRQGETFDVMRNNYIIIIDPLEETIIDPFVSNFDGNFLPTQLVVENPDLGTTFEYSNVDLNNDPTSGSIKVDNFNNKSELLPTEDHLTLTNYNTTGIKKFTVSFDYAYTYIPFQRQAGTVAIPAIYDTLILQTKQQCSVQSLLLLNTGGEDLSTREPMLTAFIPSGPSEWRTYSQEINVDEDTEFIGFQFISLSYGGNNIYIDNVKIIPDYTVEKPSEFRLSKVVDGVATIRWLDQSTNETAYILERSISGAAFEVYKTLDANSLFYRDTLETGNSYSYRLYADGAHGNRSEYTDVIEIGQVLNVEQEQNNFDIYPNPTSDIIVIKGKENISYFISDLTGKVLLSGNIKGTENSIDLSRFENGIYLFHSWENGEQKAKRIIKIK